MSNDTQPPGDTRQPASRGLLDELGSIRALLDDAPRTATPYTSINDIGSVEEYLQLKQQAARSGLSVEAYLSQQAAAQATGDELAHANDDDDEEAIALLDELYEIEEATAQDDDDDSLLLELADEEVTEEAKEEAKEESGQKESPPLTVEAYFAAVAAAKRPQQVPPEGRPAKGGPLPQEGATAEASIPLLDEVITLDAATPSREGASAPAGAQAQLSLDELQELVDLIIMRTLERIKPELQREVMAELRRLLSHPGPT
jgi:hypothetical protein